MKLLSLALRNLKQRLLTTTLTSLSILLGAALVSGIWITASEAYKRYVTSPRGFDVIVGPKSMAQLDLVLSTLFLVKDSTGTVPLSVYKELHDDKRRWGRWVRSAIPFAFGDSYRGKKIIATTDEFFLKWGKKRDKKVDNQPPHLAFAEGRPFKFSHADLLEEEKFQEHMASTHDHSGHDHDHAHDVPEKWKEVVLGAEVARTLKLKLGDTVLPTHGTEANALHVHEEARSKVVGILASTNSPIDRAIFMPLGTFYRLAEHEAVEKGGNGNSWKGVQISAIVVNARGGIGPFQVYRKFRNRLDSHGAMPAVEVRSLFAVVGNIADMLNVIAWIVLVVAAIGIFVALYNTMSDRRRDISIMRSLGARRSQIFGIVILEAVVITSIGALLGVLLAHGGAAWFSDLFADKTGVPLSGAGFVIEELWLILGTVGLGVIAGLLPAWQASRTDVARFLTADR